ncbi:delta-60 repeat domain-containing protein [Sorangium cellulosum]|uniref:Uncharacterized protein n=2 Tax=Sorangium cellulosum TaxID=56 RepID=S4YBE1_SORCE|nr:delta-60 repeat domain-containing protein [Sorangium cellulosum]AGP40108.1 hypothetical protein SCE1572_39785 [Sorangium cellulosum So0157-2]
MKTLYALLTLLVPSHLLAGAPADSAPPDRAAPARGGERCGCAGDEPGPLAGQLDPAFGEAGTGIARVRFGADDDGGFFDVDVADDRIIAAGWGQGGLGGIRFRVVRLTGAGAPDSTFGDGMVTTGWANSTGDMAYLAATGRQQGGEIVAIGWRDRFRDASADVALARYAEDGSLDPGFGDGGKSLLDLGGDEEIRGGLVAPDDGIVAVGQRDGRLLIARATADGARDTSFASPRGYRTVSLGAASVAEAVALDDRGRVVVAGAVERGGQRDMIVIRLRGDGALDRSFGRGGAIVAGDPGIDERAVALALSPGGGIVVAGDAGAEGARDFQVRRFHPNGAPDLAFGDGGVAAWPTTGGDDVAEDMALLPGGAVLVAGNGGERGEGGTTTPLLVRYTCDGALDPAFGEGGVLPVDLGEFGQLHTVEVVSDDQVLLGGGDVGMSPGPGTYGVVARMWM